MALTEEKIAELIAAGIAEHKKEKSWFMKLGWLWKILISIPIFIGSISVVGTSLSYVLDLVNHEEIARDKNERKLLYNLVKMDSSIISGVDKNRLSIDTLKRKGIEGGKFYAVGYRAEKLPDGTIIKHYRDWDGKDHLIFPDPGFSTQKFTYWFYNNEDGTKEWTLGK